MAYRSIYGVTKEQEVVPEWQARDIRSPFHKFLDWLRAPYSAFLSALALTAAVGLMPEVVPLVLPLLMVLVAVAVASKEEAPLKLPIQAGLPDPNEIDPGTQRPALAKGIFFLGNDIRSGKELWLTNSDCRQHFLVLGTTGAGKTEALIGFGANALSWSSGFLFCDGKGDVALMAKMYALLRRFGREDDLLVLNFMNDASSVQAGRVNTNSINPFATGTADELTQMLVSLMDEVGGDGAMWKGRAVAMLTGVIRALVEKRDKGLLDLNVGEIRRHLTLSAIEALAKDTQNLSPTTIAALEAYLKSLPGYKENPGEKGQAQTTLDQHGYLQMQFTKILGSLTDVYGHIFATPYGEVDISDVVLNRRILVIMLPALKKSGDEINNLGKIVVANLKGMMGNVLGSTIDGKYEDIVEKRVTNAPSPFIVVLDEVGYYTVDGMAVMAAQARSLGFSLVFASQDIPAMKRRNEKEADSIIANTNVKIIMRLEDPGATARLAIERGDKALRVRVSGFDRSVAGASGINYVENAQASFEETSRISLRDLAAQKEGEMHVIFQDKIIRARGFFANPEGAIEKAVLYPRPNHFVRVPRPSSDRYRRHPEIEDLIARIAEVGRSGKQPGDALASAWRQMEQELAGADPVMAVVQGALGGGEITRGSVQSKACLAIARLAHKDNLKDDIDEEEEEFLLPLASVAKEGERGRAGSGGVRVAAAAAAAMAAATFPSEEQKDAFRRLLDGAAGEHSRASGAEGSGGSDRRYLDELDALVPSTFADDRHTRAEEGEEAPPGKVAVEKDGTSDSESDVTDVLLGILMDEDEEEEEW